MEAFSTRTSFGRSTLVNDRQPRYEFLTSSSSTPREKRKNNGKENHAPENKKPKVEQKEQATLNGHSTNRQSSSSMNNSSNVFLQNCVPSSIKIALEIIKTSNNPNAVGQVPQLELLLLKSQLKLQFV